MDFDPSDPHLLERLRKLPLAFLSKNSGVKTSAIVLGIILTVINVLVIFCLASFVVYMNIMVLPEELPNEMEKVNKPLDSDSLSLVIPADGFYVIQSRVTFDCQVPIDRSNHKLSIDKLSLANDLVFDRRHMNLEHRQNVTCYDSHIVSFVDISKGQRLKFNPEHVDVVGLSVFKIAEYSTIRKFVT